MKGFSNTIDLNAGFLKLSPEGRALNVQFEVRLENL